VLQFHMFTSGCLCYDILLAIGWQGWQAECCAYRCPGGNAGGVATSGRMGATAVVLGGAASNETLLFTVSGSAVSLSACRATERSATEAR